MTEEQATEMIARWTQIRDTQADQLLLDHVICYGVAFTAGVTSWLAVLWGKWQKRVW